MIKRFWTFMLNGGFIRGNKRYIIFPPYIAVVLTLTFWLLNQPISLLNYLKEPKTIIFIVICLVFGGPCIYFLDKVFGKNTNNK